MNNKPLYKACRIDGDRTTLLLAYNGGIPWIAHFGERLAENAPIEVLCAGLSRPVPRNNIDQPANVSLLPETGIGFMGHPGLLAHRPSSERGDWSGVFKLISIEQDRPSQARIICRDEPRGLTLETNIEIVDDVAALTNKLINDNEHELVVDWFAAPSLPITDCFTDIMSFAGRWTAEFEVARTQMQLGQVNHENRRGRTSHEAFPGVIFIEANGGEDAGRCMGIHFAWSGNHRSIAERLPSGHQQVQYGVITLPGEIKLQKGEEFATPTLYAAASDEGLNDLSQRFHTFLRNNIIKFPDPTKPRPLTINTWEGLYFDHSKEKLEALADAAAEVGAERFVLDDGWFKGRDDDTTSLGDWVVDQRKYPDGLGPLVDYVLSKGMEFGIWYEPEMVNPDSDLYRTHPEWALQLSPYPLSTGRQQLVLDMSNPAVRDYLFDQMSEVLSKFAISYIKWDMNRDHVLQGNQQGKAASYAQVTGLYALIDRLREAFPNVEIESCSSGGGRVDFEILKRTHRFWASDSNDPVERVRIQKGMSYFFPPEVMGAHVGPAWCHTSGRGFRPQFRAAVASTGHMGFELALNEDTKNEHEQFKIAATRYKNDRSLLHNGKQYRVEMADHHMAGISVVSQDRSAARVVLFQFDRPRNAIAPVYTISGLDDNRLYKVTLDMSDPHIVAATRIWDSPLKDGNPVVIDGRSLRLVGIQLPILEAQSAVYVSYNTVEEAA